MDDDDTTVRAAAVALLAPLHAARKRMNEADREQAALAKRLRQYLDALGIEELVDGEHELRAWYESRSNTKYDLRSLAEAHPDVLVWAARNGLLSASHTAISDARKRAPASELDTLADYAIPEHTASLKVGGFE